MQRRIGGIECEEGVVQGGEKSRQVIPGENGDRKQRSCGTIRDTCESQTQEAGTEQTGRKSGKTTLTAEQCEHFVQGRILK